MIKLNVPDMTCSHCAGVITKAIKTLDQTAIVEADLGSKVVSVQSSAPAKEVSMAVNDAGYPNSIA